ncbi:MAG: GAF domain-containing protein [Clostridiales bacterium]|jgi:L-methionine (R)-S-oxide reductase|nr:GAF domain-containing protein [Clostridiales bacterium]
MFDVERIDAPNKREFYEQLNKYLEGLVGEEADWLAGISNASALLYLLMPDINWAGFYIYKGGRLVLGPFQGRPACTYIEMGKGVCGTAAKTRRIQVVEDVSRFPGHIACDARSQSEIVVPIIKDERLIGVLDIDSPATARFDGEDAEGLEDFVHILNRHIAWPEELGVG